MGTMMEPLFTGDSAASGLERVSRSGFLQISLAVMAVQQLMGDQANATGATPPTEGWNLGMGVSLIEKGPLLQRDRRRLRPLSVAKPATFETSET